MALIRTSETNVTSIFLGFEEFFRKMGKMDLFDTLVYNYRLKEFIPMENIKDIRDILKELILHLKDLEYPLQAAAVALSAKVPGQRTMADMQKLKDEGKHLHGLENGSLEPSPSQVDFFCCQLCLYSFKCEENFRAHVCSRTVRKFNQQSTSSEAESTGHSFVPNHSLRMLKKFICGLCDEEHRSFANISFHLEICTGGPFQCEFCPITFDTRRSLNVHKISSHKEVKSFICGKCGSFFKAKCSLQKHMIRTHGKDQGPFICVDCKEIFVKRIQLTNHKLKIHDMPRKYLCQQCGIPFSTAETLRIHLLEKHSEQPKFICKLCNKQFIRKDAFELHANVHTGERPFVCEFCGKRLSRKSKLENHLRRHL